MIRQWATGFCLVLAGIPAVAAEAPQPVTVDNFVRAESDLYMAGMVKDGGRSASLSTAASPLRSISKPSSASIGTRCIQRRCSISMPDP